MRSLLRGILVAVIALACSHPVLAQTLYGSLVGTVTDSSGLAVPGATVKITQAETNQSREATTNAQGAYSFPNIATGTYKSIWRCRGSRRSDRGASSCSRTPPCASMRS